MLLPTKIIRKLLSEPGPGKTCAVSQLSHSLLALMSLTRFLVDWVSVSHLTTSTSSAVSKLKLKCK